MSDEIDMLQDERRRHIRFGKHTPIIYRRFEDLAQDAHVQHGELRDFSGGGVRFLAGQALEKNSQLILELDFPGWQEEGDDWIQTGDPADIGRLRAIGAVMWCARDAGADDKYEIGVRFTGRIR